MNQGNQATAAGNVGSRGGGEANSAGHGPSVYYRRQLSQSQPGRDALIRHLQRNNN